MKKLSIMILMAATMLTACGDGNRTSPEDPDYISTHGEGEDVDEMVIDRTGTAAEDEAMAQTAYWTVDMNNINATEESVRGNLDQMDQNIDRIEADIRDTKAETPETQQKLEEVKQQVAQAEQTLREARQQYEANKYEEASAKIKQANQTLEEARTTYVEVKNVVTVDRERETNEDAL